MFLVNPTWLELKPNEDIHGNQESFEDYYSRIKRKEHFSHIPREVLKQWIHPHHKNHETLRNYAWINYEYTTFILCEWTYEELNKVRVIEQYSDYVHLRSSYDDLEEFCCKESDLKHWQEQGTWATPPIVLDVNPLLPLKPEWSDITPAFQLVEGHSRLGYLNSMKRIVEAGKYKLADKHRIYLMQHVPSSH